MRRRLGHRDHVDVDRARVPDHPVDNGRSEQLPGTRPFAGPQHHLRDILGPGEVEQRLRHAPPDHLVERPAYHLDELPRRLQCRDIFGACLGDHVDGEQLAASASGHASSSADQGLVFRATRDADQDAFARFPRTFDPVVPHVVLERFVDAVGHPQQSKLTERAQVALAEVVRQGGVDLLRRIDVAMGHAPPERERRHVDQLHLIRGADDLVGDRLALLRAGDPLDDVVQRLEVLDVHGGDDVDPRLEQLLDVLPSLLVPRARDVRVCQLIDQRDLGRSGQDRVDVHLLESRAPVLDRPPGGDLQVAQALAGLGTAVGLDEPDHDIGTALPTTQALAQHREGLADAGRVAEVDAEAAARGHGSTLGVPARG